MFGNNCPLENAINTDIHSATGIYSYWKEGKRYKPRIVVEVLSVLDISFLATNIKSYE